MVGGIMRVGLCSAALVLGVSLAAPAGAAPAYPASIDRAIGSQTENTSFWGLPYPYGYAQRSSGCVRYVRVRTASGVRVRKTWVCR